MTKQIKVGRARKFMWYGWQSDAANHFGCSTNTVERWRAETDQGDAVAMRRNELIDWCREKLRAIGKTDEEIQQKITEAFGEC